VNHRRTATVLADLSPADQTRFWAYGLGERTTLAHQLIHKPFEISATQDPHRVAVEHLGESLTYGELNDHAERLAVVLQQLGVRPGDHVGLFLRRSIPMVVGILATLKVGAAYVPQDLRITPAGHLSHIIQTARIRVILTVSDLADRIPLHDDHVVVTVDTLMAAVSSTGSRASSGLVPSTGTISPQGTAVVIFTSGTTGRPNGVSVTHANLCNVVLQGPGSLGIEPGMRVGQILNIAFDMAVWEIFGALTHGATLVIRGCDIEVTAEGCDVLIATPSILGSLDPDRCRNVKIVAVAGERCPVPLADAWSEFARFHNSCGPTEVTIVNTLVRYVPGRGDLTIGRPLPNTTVYILDDHQRPCPIGVVGEMWAGGACVTAGYLGNSPLTAERYRPDPFLGGGARMFRTRDLGRWTEAGLLEHHGRTDDQVKVHGFRVELDAVTSALELTPGCVQATTILHDGELVGFVTPSAVDENDARRAVSSRLPYYYTPSLIVGLDELPRTERGKIDKRVLGSWLATDLASARRSELEAAVA
jgi:amino acid adenylation domain-containing protein